MLGFDRTGQGEPIVLLHPLGADRRVWDRVVPSLADQYAVIAIDLPGFGDSPPLPTGAATAPTPAALAGAVTGFLQEIGVERPVVAGNSLGGWVALELALAGHARSVIAFGPAGMWSRALGPKAPVARTLAGLARPIIPLAARTKAGRRVLLAGAAAHPDRVPATMAAHLVRSYATAPGFTAVNAAMRAGTFTGLAGIEVPVTLVWGEHDTLVRPPRVLPPSIESIDLAGVAHMPMLDAPERVAGLIAERAARGVRPGRPAPERRAAR